MALTLEDGTGVAGAEAYDAVASAVTWLTNRAMTVYAALSTADQEAHMRLAVEHVEAMSRDGLTGYRRFTVEGSIQPLNYPRLDAYYVDGGVIGSSERPATYREAIYLACELSADGKLDSAPPAGVKRERFDRGEIEYTDTGSAAYPHAEIAAKVARVSRLPGEWRAA